MENNSVTIYKPAKIVAIPAKIISYVFHPLFIPTYIFAFLVNVVPYEFPGIGDWQLKLRIFSVFWMTAFFPGFAVFLLWRLKLGVNSMFLRTQKERIIPFIITMFFYWWWFYLSKNFKDQPEVLKFFFFGIFISTSAGVVLNNFMKISLHGMGVGGGLMAIILITFFYQMPSGLSITIATLITGLVCSSRLIISDHTNKEVYIGLLVGAVCQLIGYKVMM